MLLRSTVAVAALLLAAGCGGGSDDTSTGATEPAASTPAGPADTFCADIEAAGADGASFGAIPIYDTKAIEKIVADNADILAVEPPDEIADDWAVRKDYLAEIDQWVKDGGPSTGGPPDSTESDASSQKITDYYFDTCA